MANASLQIGNGNWAIKEDNLLGYSKAGTRFLPIPITMTRATLGTRVNPSGLIEDVELLGSEEVTNGDFSQEGSEEVTNGDFATDSDWTKGTGWTISGGKAVATSVGSGQRLQQNFSFTNGKSYKIVLVLSSYTSGRLGLYMGGAYIEQDIIAEGTYTYYHTPTSGSEFFFRVMNSGTTLSIDNVSVKEVGQNWQLQYTGTGDWSITDKLNFENVNGGSAQLNVFEVGKIYKITVDYVFTSGTRLILPYDGSNFPSGGVITTTGSVNGYTYYYTPNSTTLLIYSDGNGNGSVDNVSVKQATIDDLARVDYTDGTASLLAEPQRTNLIPYSEDFSQWALVNGTILSNTTTSPSGEINADKFTFISGYAQLRYTLTVASSTQYSASFYVKNLDSTNVEYRVYDVTNGTDILSSSYYSQISNTEWTRVSFEFNTSATTSSIYFYPIAGSYSGSLYIWGAQLEAGSYPTSYIKTQGSTVTRNQDEYSKTGISDKINSEEGVLFVEMAALADNVESGRISVSNGTVNEYFSFDYRSTSNTLRLVYNVGGTNLIVSNIVTGFSNSNLNKIAYRYKSGQHALYVNGILKFTSTETSTYAANTLNQIDFSLPNNTSIFNGKVKQLQVFKTALSDSELATLTT
jgi:hypothetical protein